jgi:hypothetical protein
MKNILILFMLVAVGWIGYQRHQLGVQRAERAQIPVPHEPVEIAAPVLREVRAAYSCDGRKYCSEMHSCEEAKYFLKHCPTVKMDGDNDGIPCEMQWCNVDEKKSGARAGFPEN